MMVKGMARLALIPTMALGLVACGQSSGTAATPATGGADTSAATDAVAGTVATVEGTYNMVNGPVPGVVATFGKTSFALSTGASGSYEVSDGKVILSGMSLSGTYRIEGDKLVGDRFTFARRAPNDTTPIARGPRG